MKYINKINFLMVFLVFAFLCSTIIQVEAKRVPPSLIEPVIYNGVNYTTGKMGFVEAWDINTSQKIWEKKVYSVKYNPLLETDVQDVFITSLSISDGKLVVINEKGNKYEVNVETGAVYNDNSRILLSIVIVFLVFIGGYFLFNYLMKKSKL